MDNSDQIAFWNSDSGGKWVRNQERMDRTLAPFSSHVLETTGLTVGERVLDVGCGTGQTSVTMATRGADVTAVDVSRPMLEHARTRADADKVRFQEADAASADFGDGAFDLVFSRFGVMFFADADAAFANLGRMTRSGGRIAFACWRPLSENPWMLKPVLVARDFVEMPPRPGPEAPGPFSFADPERVTRILKAGGYSDIAIQPYDHPIFMGETIDDALVTALEVGPVGAAATNAPEDRVAAMKIALKEMLSTAQGPNGIQLPGAIWCVTASRG